MKLLTKAKIMTVAVLLAVVGIGIAGTPAFAVESNVETIALSMSPTRLDIDLQPGKTATGEFLVYNDGTVDFRVLVKATPYQVTADYSTNSFETENKWTQISRWITFRFADSEDEWRSELVFNMDSSTQQRIEYRVVVPSNPPDGGQYAGLLAETVPPEDATGVVPKHQIAILLHSHIAGKTVLKYEVTDRKVGFWHISGDIATSFKIRNTGNVDFDSLNSQTLTTLWGSTAFSAEKDPVMDPGKNPVDKEEEEKNRNDIDPKRVLPEAERTIKLKNHSPWLAGFFWLEQKTVIGDDVVSVRKLILIMPIWLIILIILAVIALVVLIVRSVTNRKHKTKLRTYEKD